MDPKDYAAAFAKARAEIEELHEEQRTRVLELFEEALRKQGEIIEDSRHAEEVARRLGHSVESLRESAERLQDQLQDMRIAAKLLLLDLEASRREKGNQPDDDEDTED
jgi:truncated hemoglobin YjbI